MPQAFKVQTTESDTVSAPSDIKKIIAVQDADLPARIPSPGLGPRGLCRRGSEKLQGQAEGHSQLGWNEQEETARQDRAGRTSTPIRTQN